MDFVVQKGFIMQIVLASASPRRQELLKNIFPEFTIHTSSCEEHTIFETPSKYVMDLARQKALDVSQHYTENTLIIGADTIVYSGGKILGKPAGKEDARKMIRSLSGQSHEVYTGISLVCIDNGSSNTYSSYECTKVNVDNLSEDEIEAYLNFSDLRDSHSIQHEWEDKAGGYAIQGYFSRHITGIEGDYFNVVGLPVHLLYAELKNKNILP